MGRMLKALQQVGAAKDGGETIQPLTPEELAAFGLSRLAKPQPSDSLPSKPDVSPSSAPSRGSPATSGRTSNSPVVEPPVPIPPAAAMPAPAALVSVASVCPTMEPLAISGSAAQIDTLRGGEPSTMADAPASCTATEVRWSGPAAAVSELAVTADNVATAPSELDRLLNDAARQRQRQYRDLADTLLAKVPSGRPAALLFTSASDSQGNCSILADLAVALSRRVAGEVIVVDADFQNPCLGRFLGVDAERNLLDVALGAADWREVVRRTKTARLSILPGGRSVDTHPEVSRLGPLLDELRCHYDLLLLQAASVAHGEVGVLARHSDATYLTVRLGRDSRRQVRQAAAILQRSGAALLGSIVIGD